MIWNVFADQESKVTFRREYGIENEDGDRVVLAWVSLEGHEYAMDSEVGRREYMKWKLRAVSICQAEALARSR